MSDFRERKRRLVHLAFGGVAFLVPLLGRVGSITLAAAALLYNVLLAPTFGLDRGYRRAGEPRWAGIGTYPLAVLLLLCVAPLQIAMAAWGVLAVGDPAAAAAGKRWSSPSLPWNASKTWLGSLAAAVGGTLAAGMFLLYAGTPGGFGAVWAPAAAAGLAGALAESLPWPVDDNLPMAGAAAAAMVLGGA